MQAVIYARISKDTQREALGVSRQEALCRERADQLGWTVTQVFTDNDLGASKGRARPGYDQMLAGVEAGEVRAIVCYDADRLTRRPTELEHLIDLVDAHGVRLANVAGEFNMTDPGQRGMLRMRGVFARMETEQQAKRVRDQKRQLAESGKPLGQRYRTFGYEKDWSVREPEAEVVREVFSRALSGESQTSITKSLVARGVTTVSGKTWTALNTSRLLKNDRYTGVAKFKGEVIGRSSVPALITEAEFAAVQRPETQSGFNARKYMLSGILICDKCKAPMFGTKANDHQGGRYRCDSRQGGCGNVSIKMEWVDDLVNRYMSNAVLFPVNPFTGEEPSTHESKTDDTQATIERLDAEIGFVTDSDLALADKVALLKNLRQKRNSLEREQVQSVVESRWQPIEDFDNADLSIKKSAIQRFIKHIFIAPGSRSRFLDMNRISVLMVSGDLVPAVLIDTIDYRIRDENGHLIIDQG